MSSTAEEQGCVVLGQVNGLHGVSGGMKIYSYTRPREQIFSYNPWLIHTTAGWIEKKVRNKHIQGKGLVVFLDGIENREQAQTLVGLDIAIDRKQLPVLAEGEYYWNDLINLEVFDQTGKKLGMVLKLEETGANDVLVVETDESNILIPFVKDEVIKEVNLDKGLLRVDWNPEFI